MNVLLATLSRSGKLKFLREEEMVLRELDSLSTYFRAMTGSTLTGPQRSWALRFLRGESFSITAPPGMGKTTFGLSASIFNAVRGAKSVLVFPTKSLVSQAEVKLRDVTSKLGLSVKFVSTVKKEPEGEDFHILLTTSKYAMLHRELANHDFRMIFVDDVDAVTKSRKSTYMLLELAGFSKDELSSLRDASREGDSLKVREIRERVLNGKVVILSSASVTRVTPIISSALGLRPGGTAIYSRNIVDTYMEFPSDVAVELKKVLRTLGTGGLVYVSVDKGMELAKRIHEELSEELRVGLVNSTSSKAVERFRGGELDYLVGVATHYGPLVRGLDMPSRVRYAIFVGVPKFKFVLGEKMHPLAALRLLVTLASVKRLTELYSLVGQMRKKLRTLSPSALAVVANAIREGKLEDKVFARVYDVVQRSLEDKETLQRMMEAGGFVLQDGLLLLPDYVTYLQASARTSRLLGGGLTTGLSVVLVDDWRLFSAFKNRLSFVLDDVIWYPLNLAEGKVGDKELGDLMSKIDEERNAGVQDELKLRTVLFIVESPNKARTISNLFGKPAVRELNGLRAYEVMIGDALVTVTYSGGHIYDLTTREVDLHGVRVVDDGVNFVPQYDAILRCGNGHSYVPSDSEGCPVCKSTLVSVDKLQVVNSLRRLSMEVDQVLIGTDPDTEGEKIAWDVYLNLRPFNTNIMRAEFHEVTRKAVLSALRSPRLMNLNLVASQVVRRIEDRWIGFELSQRLWREFWPQYCRSRGFEQCGENRWLSAGRVQTPVLGWIIRRYNEYQDTKVRAYALEFDGKFLVIDKAPGVRKNSQLTVKIGEVSEHVDIFGPLPPYTTDSMLTDAFRFLRLGAGETMRLAQELFEFGLITYHRTDSTRVSDVGISVARNYLTELLSEDVSNVFEPKTWGEGGAHEAIRPTKPVDVDQLRVLVEEGTITLPRPLEYDHYRLYQLIFRRFIGSQVKPITLVKQEAPFEVHSKNGQLVSRGRLEFIVDVKYPDPRLSGRTFSPPVRTQPPLKPGEYVAKVTRSFLRSQVELYTQGDVITEMKLKQVGRPSTYSTIMGKLLEKRYVMESRFSRRLIPSRLGGEVYNFLTSKYGDFVSEERTRKLLELMDQVEEAKVDYRDVLMQLYSEIKNIRG
ncbi:reverse gyrase [Sulfodiicoccus acidiphilus]|uniref:Reverse gyrase n=1 Tax=Sulfodiicoccus acidiphilus TaxID=1670455 RepID=A0A348B1A3_9CREN|nr:reverse gyrase [Sulfodiicoccus acidiphilus]GGT91736.1 reverse gyrase [Sulfodiicoccus acidiphilus]